VCDAARIFGKGKIAKGALNFEDDARIPVIPGIDGCRDVGGQFTIADQSDATTLPAFDLIRPLAARSATAGHAPVSARPGTPNMARRSCTRPNTLSTTERSAEPALQVVGPRYLAF
jgi:hypothetical protein